MLIFMGDKVELRLNAHSDISGFSSYQVKYAKPSGVTGVWTGALLGTEYVTYTTSVSDLDTIGVWKLQIYIGGAAVHGQVAQMIVAAPISLV